MPGVSGGVSDDIISMTIDDDILICELPASGVEAFSRETTWEAYVSLLSRHDLKGVITVFSADESIDTTASDTWDRTMQRAATEGITRWIIVTDIPEERIQAELPSPTDIEISVCADQQAGITCLRNHQ